MNHSAKAFLIILMISACSQKQSENVKTEEAPSSLKVKIFTYDAQDTAKNGDSLATLPLEKYLELTLSSMDKGKRFAATKIIEHSEEVKHYRNVELYIVNDDGTDLYFKDATEFMNYMDKLGYDIVDQKKTKYHTDFTFKKR